MPASFETSQPTPILANAETIPEVSQSLSIDAMADPDIHERMAEPASLIGRAATNVGIELPPDRLTTLAGMARDFRSNQQAGFKSTFLNGGLLVYPTSLSGGKKIAFVHFRPDTAQAKQAETPQTQEATKVALTGLEAMQNYALLVDAGYIERPDILRGATNPNMTRAATRLGFSATDGEDPKTIGDFQTIHDRVFSPEMIAFGEKLSNRLATMRPPRTPTTMQLR